MLTHSTAVAAAPSRVVILGATGFLGAKLTNRLFEEEVLVLPLSTQDIDLSAQGAGKKLSELLLPTDTIVFLSAISGAKARNGAALITNMKMAQAVCAATATVRPKHLIYASSDAVYPFTQAVLTETSFAAPVDLYGAMHRARELLLSTECSIPLGILRFTAIYGALIRTIRTDQIVSFLKLSMRKKYRSLETVRRPEIISILMMRSRLYEGSSLVALRGYLTLRAATVLVSRKSPNVSQQTARR